MIEQELMIVFTTAPDAATAERIARALVEEGLAACVNRVPGLRSTYVWDGAIHDDEEILMIAKTTAARLPALRERLVALHPYELPEVIAVRVADGHDPYLRWVAMATGTASA
jgi:periplasmic divalent cation tolerance protein